MTSPLPGTSRRKTAAPDPKILSQPRDRPWPPACTVCGWTGPADDTASPYLACDGDPARHTRTPVGAR